MTDTTTTTKAPRPDDDGRLTAFTSWLKSNSDTDASEKALKRMPLFLRVLLKFVYLAGVGGLGWATYDLFRATAGFPMLPSLGLTIVIESFTLVSAHFYVRARLRGKMAWHKALPVYLGVLGSAGLQIYFHFEDNRARAVGLTVAGIFALISWVLNVNDEHAPIFERQAEAKRARRQLRRMSRKGMLAYAFANTPWRTVAEWRRRTVTVGRAARDVDEALSVRHHEARLNVVAGTIVGDDGTDADGRRLGPFPPHPGIDQRRPVSAPSLFDGRQMSAPPSVTVEGDDEHAEHMRSLSDKTACAMYAAQIAGPDVGGAALQRWLAAYGVVCGASTVREARLRVHPKEVTDGKLAANG